MNFEKYLYERLEEINQARARINTNTPRLVWLNGQREILTQIIEDYKNGNNNSKANSNS
jgi:ribosomal protein L18